MASADLGVARTEPRRAVWIRWGILGLLLGFLIALSLWDVQRTYIDVAFEDAFVHVPMIGDFLSGHGSLRGIIGPFYGGHLLIGYRLLMLVNAKLFSLDMRLDPVMSVAASAAMAAVIYAEFTSRLKALRSLTAGLLASPLVMLCFSLVAPPVMLMTTQFVWGTAVALAVAWLLQRDFRRDPNDIRVFTGNTVGAMALIVVYFLLLSGAYFPGFLAGAAAMVGVRWIVGRQRPGRSIWAVGVVIVASTGIYAWFANRSSEQGTTSGGLRMFFTHGADTVLSYVTGMGASLVDIHTLEGHSQVIWLILGFALLALTVGAVIVYVRLRLYEMSYVPLYCLAYPLGVITMIRIGRASQGGWSWMGSEWYLFHYRFFVIGLVWILLYAAVSVVRTGWRPTRQWKSVGTLVATLFVLSAILVAGTHMISNGKQWKRGPYVKYWLVEKRNALLFPTYYDDPAAVVLVSEGEFAPSRAILEDHRLSAFSAHSLASMENSAGVTFVPLEGWAADAWISRRAVGVVIAPSAGSAQFRAYVPEFLPGNFLRVTVNGDVAFSEKIAAGEERTFSVPVAAGTNDITVACARSVSPASLGVSQDQRSLGVQLTLMSTTSQ